MSLTMITDDTVKKLKCDLCNNYLSYFPIFISNDKNICGRFCLHPQEESELRINKIFETVVESIEFPCQYEKQGCFEKYFPKDIIEHEKKCSFRTIKCPARQISECNWEGMLPTVLDHCQNKHNDVILNDGNFEFNLAESYQRENLLQHDSALFLVFQNFTFLNKLMEINIRYPDYVYDIKDDPWKITFETTNRELNIQIDTQAFEDNKITMIYLDNVVDDAGSQEIEVKGKIMLDQSIENKSEFNKEENDEFLALLKCSSCSNYAQPPIYEVTVSKGQTEKRIQCSECRSKLENNSTLRGVGNYTLDRLAEKVSFPCANQVKGCTFKSKPSTLGNHRLTCPYREFDCPVSEFVSCNWKGLVIDVQNHIEQIHSNIILKSSNLFEKLAYDFDGKFIINVRNKTVCHIIKFINRYFIFNFFQNVEEFHWVVQQIDDNLSNDHFNFEIEIISRKNEYNSLRRRQSCLIGFAMTKEEMLKVKNCCFNYRQIKDFIEVHNGAWYLNFNVKIFK